MVEHPAVNRRVAGSSPACGACAESIEGLFDDSTELVEVSSRPSLVERDGICRYEGGGLLYLCPKGGARPRRHRHSHDAGKEKKALTSGFLTTNKGDSLAGFHVLNRHSIANTLP
jgi:hypothetical protein